jgi:hypothetical protein
MQPNIIKSAMFNGLIMGVLFTFNFMISLPKNTILSLLSYLIVAGIIFLMYKMSVQFRDKECEGYITYGKAFMFVIYTFFFAALISSLVKYFYFRFINPSYLDELLQESLKAMEMMKFKVDDEAYKQISDMMKPANMALQFIWVNMFLGMIVGLVMAAFVKKEKNIFEE